MKVLVAFSDHAHLRLASDKANPLRNGTALGIEVQRAHGQRAEHLPLYPADDVVYHRADGRVISVVAAVSSHLKVLNKVVSSWLEMRPERHKRLVNLIVSMSSIVDDYVYVRTDRVHPIIQSCDTALVTSDYTSTV